VLIRVEAFHGVVGVVSLLLQLVDDVLIDLGLGLRCYWYAVKANDDAGRDLMLPTVDVEPRVHLHLLDRNTLLGVRGEDTLEEILSIRRNELGDRVLPIQDFLVQSRRVLVLEWQAATERCVKDYPAAPDIDHQPIVLLASDHLPNDGADVPPELHNRDSRKPF
jgi:hypothetical protein